MAQEKEMTQMEENKNQTAEEIQTEDKKSEDKKAKKTTKKKAVKGAKK